MKVLQNGGLVRFSKMVGASLAGASVTKTATSLGVSRAAVSKVLTAYTNHGKISPAERNGVRNPKLSESDRQTLKKIKSKNHRTAAAKVSAEFSNHLEVPVSTKTVQRELHRSNIHSRAAIAKPLNTESKAVRPKRWCVDHKNWRYYD
jgi:transposase